MLKEILTLALIAFGNASNIETTQDFEHLYTINDDVLKISNRQTLNAAKIDEILEVIINKNSNIIHQIRKMDLSNIILDMIPSNIKKFENLETLDLSGVINKYNAKSAAELLSSLKDLETLNISDIANNESMVAIKDFIPSIMKSLKNCRKLKSLAISNINLQTLFGAFRGIGIEEDGMFIFVNLLEEWKENFESLDISNNLKFADREIKILEPKLKECKKFKALNISGTGISDEGAKILANLLGEWPNLESLDISSNNDIKKEGLDALIKAIKGCKNLVELDISNDNIEDDQAIEFANKLKELTNLKKLKIISDKISYNGLDALIKAIKELPNLESLDISSSNNDIKKEGLDVLIEAIKGCKNLVELGISNDNIEDDQAIEFANKLKELTNLKKLKIISDKISYNGLDALIKAIEELPNLMTLDVTLGTISVEGQTKLKELKNKRQGMKIRVTTTWIPGRYEI